MQTNQRRLATLRLVFSALLLCTFALQAQNTNIKPKITSATLYPNAAEVNLFKAVSLKKGTQTISIGGIPDDVSKDRVVIDIDGAEHNTADGALTWDVNIPANSNATRTVTFEVTRPKDE